MKPNSRILKGLATAALLVAANSSAFGAMITITGHNDYRSGDGGEFNVRAFDATGSTLIGDVVARGYVVAAGTTIGTANGTIMGGTGLGLGFETFCIEHNENINLGGNYTAAISLGSIYGGVAGGIDHDSNPVTPTTDYISVGTAYLYNAFAKGVLSGYNYTNGSGRAASAKSLQNAIWYLEDELSLSAAGGTANPFLALAFNTYGTPGTGIGNLAGGAKANNTIWNVAALNLGGVAPNQKQDQLILNDNGFSVPDGGTTLALLGFSFCGLSYLRRKLG